jgi:RNA polymerase sigma-70 factor (ECF subfamily)
VSPFELELVRCIPMLRRYAKGLSHGRPGADDLVQTTLLRALEKRDYFLMGTNMPGWLGSLMHNAYVNHIRHEVRRPLGVAVPIYDMDIAVAPAQPVKIEWIDVRHAIKALSAEEQSILSMCASGFSYVEMQDAIQVPMGTVRSQVSRARAKLRRAECR